MVMDTYKRALEQAKADLANQVAELGAAQKLAELAEKEIVELRQTVSALQRLCGESEYVEEDALGLTDAIRMTFKTAAGGASLTAQDVKELMENSGYAGRWGNLLASIHTVIKRLHTKGEIEAGGNVNGRDTFRWVGYAGIGERPGKRIARRPSGESSKGSLCNTVPSSPKTETFLDGLGGGLAQAPGDSPYGTVPSDPSHVTESPQEVTRLLESISPPLKRAR
jgi:hypothetical protein